MWGSVLLTVLVSAGVSVAVAALVCAGWQRRVVGRSVADVVAERAARLEVQRRERAVWGPPEPFELFEPPTVPQPRVTGLPESGRGVPRQARSAGGVFVEEPTSSVRASGGWADRSSGSPPPAE